ncbi:TOBE domain-containing protein [Primorskyibacter flagellatus]|nr:TOBE domain-containing protein [Primorskyibacter flagellatus]
MFIMDEPLGHLEEYLRIELRREIRALHEATGGTTFYITHDQQEAAAVSDRIAVMSEGRVQQVGTMRQLIETPNNRFVAEFVGEPPINIFETLTVDGGTMRLADFSMPLSAAQQAAFARTPPASVGIRPARLAISDSAGTGISAIATSVQPMGESGAVLCQTDAGPTTALTSADALPAEGAALRLRPDPDGLHFFAANGQRIAIEER